MPRKRENPDKVLTIAEKQERFRQRKAAETERRNGLLYALERAVWDAAEQGDPVAAVVKSQTFDGMIENLTRHFNGVNKPDA